MQYGDMRYGAEPPHPSAKKKLGGYSLFMLSAGIAFAAVALCAFSIFLWFGSEYGRAQACVDSKNFKAAQAYLLKVPAFYRDAPQLIVYAQAGDALSTGRFDVAKAFYIQLDGFRDSEDMVDEADYRKAMALLDKYDFDGAAQIFTTLAHDRYKDSATMATEVEYRRAAWLLEKKDYKGAIKTFQKLGNYKESADKAKRAADEAFAAGVSAYRTRKYDEAKKVFGIVASAKPDADKYLTLIEAHVVTVTQSNANYASTKALFDKLFAVGDFEDAEKLRVSDAFLLYRLEGAWYQPDGSLYVDYKYSSSKSMWSFAGLAIDGIKYKVMDGFLYSYADGRWNQMNRFQFLSENSMKLQWISNGEAYSTIVLSRR